MKNKIFGFFICMLFVGTFFVIALEPVSADQDGDYTYIVSSGAAYIIGYTGGGGVITIPTTLGGYPTVSIADGAFDSTTGHLVTSVVIQSGVTTIGDEAFNHCALLTTVTIPSSVTMIGIRAFAFCSSLTAINVDVGNMNYASVDGVLYNEAITTLVEYPGGIGGAFTTPVSVNTIANFAFDGCALITSVTMGNTVITIGDYAFHSCSILNSVTIGSSVTTIGNYAFSYCSSLTTITIPDSVTTIGTRAFSYCNALNAVNVNPGNINYASVDGVLYNKAITNLIVCPGGKAGTFTVPSSVITIGLYAFSYCVDLTAVTIPDSVITIGDYAFISCTSLTSLTIPNSVSTIGNAAFRICSMLTSITFLGLVAPTSVGSNWILDTPSEIRGHAYAASNFPAPGNDWNGLMMDSYISVSYDVNHDGKVNFQDAGLVWVHRTSLVPYDGLYDVNQDGQVNFQDAGLTWVNRD